MYVGQNIALTGTTGDAEVDWKTAIDMWYSEVQHMVQADVNDFGYKSTLQVNKYVVLHLLPII